jgi:hypothetical protein
MYDRNPNKNFEFEFCNIKKKLISIHILNNKSEIAPPHIIKHLSLILAVKVFISRIIYLTW